MSARQFVLGRGFVYVAQEPTITRYVVIRDGLVVWPLSTAAEKEAADFGAARRAARQHADATEKPAHIYRRTIRGKDVINESSASTVHPTKRVAR